MARIDMQVLTLKHPESIDSGGLYLSSGHITQGDLEWKLSDGRTAASQIAQSYSSEASELTCSLLWECIVGWGKTHCHHYYCMLFSGLMAK